MTTQPHYRLSACFALALLVIEAALLAHEHVTGGVRSHHLLDRADLPAISNWFGLIVMPVLGWLLGRRFRLCGWPATATAPRTRVWACLLCSLIYGAAMATSFALGVTGLTSALFFGLFLFAALFPIYRIEYVTGFVVGMAFVFGAVLPALVAMVLAGVSLVLRFSFKSVMSAVRRYVRPSGTA